VSSFFTNLVSFRSRSFFVTSTFLTASRSFGLVIFLGVTAKEGINVIINTKFIFSLRGRRKLWGLFKARDQSAPNCPPTKLLTDLFSKTPIFASVLDEGFQHRKLPVGW
jgi:hypothetical protein